MPIPFSEEQIADYLFSKSVMDEPRSLAQRVKDFLVGRTLPDQYSNAFTGPIGQLGFARVAVKPELQSLARYANTQGLGSSWFRGHGGQRTIDDVLQEGFLSRAETQKVGEPFGVSLTSNPAIAENFASSSQRPPLRVAVLSKPEEVLDLSGHTLAKYGPERLDPRANNPEQARAILRLANRYALQNYRFPEGVNSALGYQVGGLTVEDLVKKMREHIIERGYPYNKDILADSLSIALHEKALNKGAYNKHISDYLQSLGYNAVSYHPTRYNEFELRMLDTKKALPLGYFGSSGKVGKRTVHNILQDPDTMKDTKFLVRELIRDFGDSNLNRLPEKDFLDLVTAKAAQQKMGPIATRYALSDIERVVAPNYDKKVIDAFKQKHSSFFDSPDDYMDTPARLNTIYKEKPAAWYLEPQEAYKPSFYDKINLQQFGKELDSALATEKFAVSAKTHKPMYSLKEMVEAPLDKSYFD